MPWSLGAGHPTLCPLSRAVCGQREVIRASRCTRPARCRQQWLVLAVTPRARLPLMVMSSVACRCAGNEVCVSLDCFSGRRGELHQCAKDVRPQFEAHPCGKFHDLLIGKLLTQDLEHRIVDDSMISADQLSKCNRQRLLRIRVLVAWGTERGTEATTNALSERPTSLF